MNPPGNRRRRTGIRGSAACAWLMLVIGCALLGPQPPAAADDTLSLTGAWKFKADWQEEGQVKGWQRSDFDDSQWQALRVPGTWEDQGITTPNPRWPSLHPDEGYNGYAWYRRHFTVPADWRGARVGLLIAGIYDRGWIYLNGRFVGGTGPTTFVDWSPTPERPYSIPPDVLKPGANNVIALRVCDVGGAGGIVRAPVELVKLAPAPAPAAAPQPAAVARPWPTKRRESRGDIAALWANVDVPSGTLVDGDVVVVGGSADIRGHVTGDVVAVGGDVRARRGSRINGRGAVALGGRVIREQHAHIARRVGHTPMLLPLPRSAVERLWRATSLLQDLRQSALSLMTRGGYFAALRGGLVLLCGSLALLAALVFPRRLEVMARALPIRPQRAALYGAAGFVLALAAAPAALIGSLVVGRILAPSKMDIVIAPAESAATLVPLLGIGLLVALGTSAAWLGIGRAVATRLRRPHIHAAWAVLVGVLAMALIAALPVVGSLVVFASFLFGFGTALMTGLGVDPERAHHRPPRAV